VGRRDNNSAFVIGGGPSLQGFDFSKLSNRHTIGVNKSFLSLPDLEYFITVDFTFFKKIDKNLYKNHPANKFFVVDLSYPYLKEIDGRIVDIRSNLVYRLDDFDVVVKSRRKDGLGLSYDDFRTGKNSGYCALQLAIVLGFRKVYLLGFDLCTNNSTHYHGGYGESISNFNKKLKEYFSFFEGGLTDIQKKSDVQIFSCSKISLLNSIIPYVDIGEI
jgi:hypothetical protein